jgi:EAL domain-containing protein (putative c-di-GMP-specific phosphodiesterase class I)
VIRADRELLAELARLNSDVVPLAMRIMGNNATSDEQHAFAQRLIAMAQRLQARASVAVIEGNVVTIPDNETPAKTG